MPQFTKNKAHYFNKKNALNLDETKYMKSINYSSPLVTIRCITYNHKPYIRQCLDGFIMQKTNFRFEAIVHDDASTDGTAIVIREYAKKYPDIIKPIYETENQYSKHDGSLSRIMNAHTHGKYVALCEGDDYWTDPYKLQKQVDFLESHPDYVMCSHRFNQYIQDKNLLKEEKDTTFHGADYDLKNLICGKWLTQTLTVMYRWSALDIAANPAYKVSQDVVLFYRLLKQGKGFCMPDVMGVYRVHKGGVWSGISLINQREMEFNQRIAIYDVEKSEEAALFLLGLFSRAISRIWMVKHWNMFIKVSCILRKHYGTLFVMKLMFNKLLLGKGLAWDTFLQIEQKHRK